MLSPMERMRTPGVAQVLQLHEAPAVPARKARKVLDDQQVQLVRHEQPAHPLVPLALLKRIARAVAVLEKVQLAAGKWVRTYSRMMLFWFSMETLSRSSSSSTEMRQ